jgi:hypothetical protein
MITPEQHDYVVSKLEDTSNLLALAKETMEAVLTNYQQNGDVLDTLLEQTLAKIRGDVP